MENPPSQASAQNDFHRHLSGCDLCASALFFIKVPRRFQWPAKTTASGPKWHPLSAYRVTRGKKTEKSGSRGEEAGAGNTNGTANDPGGQRREGLQRDAV